MMREQTRKGASAVAARFACARADLTFVLTDAALLFTAYALVYAVSAPNLDHLWSHAWRVLLLASTIHLLCNTGLGLYGLIWRQVGIEEARRLLAAGLLMCLVSAVVRLIFDRVPLELVVLGPVVATLLTGTSRFRSRLFAFQRGTPSSSGRRLLVIGAGRTGVNLVRDLLSNPQFGSVPVAIVDDDPSLTGRSVKGVPVIGSMAQLPTIARQWSVEQVVLAIPSANQELVQRAAAAADDLGAPLRVVPTVHELVAGVSAVRQVRKTRVEDLLGRSQVETDLDAVERLIAGRTVLLTGAGGSIGSELARQIARFSPRQLLMLDHDETHLFDATLSVDENRRDLCSEVLADIRDAASVRGVFAQHRPDVVFHAAAHKHVPILEKYPLEGIATNVFGTLNLLESATEFETDRFVLISTDKAVRPRSVLGATKRLAEQLLEAHVHPRGRYCAVRFGNVLGSRGSVVPTFERQIATGGPLTVTDPDMTRYFMSIVEAVQLVLQAAVFTDDNDLFMLEMGQPVKIMDLAHLMIRLSGHTTSEIPIHVTGARPGEKQCEELHTHSEVLVPTAHPSIERLLPSGRAEPIVEQLEELRVLVQRKRSEDARRLLFAIVSGVDSEPSGTPSRVPLPRVGSPQEQRPGVASVAATDLSVP